MASFRVKVKRIVEKKVWVNEEKCEIGEMYKWRYIEKDDVGEIEMMIENNGLYGSNVPEIWRRSVWSMI